MRIAGRIPRVGQRLLELRRRQTGRRFAPFALAAVLVWTLNLRAGPLADHVFSVSILTGQEIYPASGNGTVMFPDLDIEVSTDHTVTAVTVVSPGGKSFTLDRDENSDRQDEVDWEYETDDSQLAADFGDGACSVTVRFTDGAEQEFSIPFLREDGSALQRPAQIPEIAGAGDAGIVALASSSGTISWAACTDPAANAVHFELESDSDLAPYDQELLRTVAEDAAAGHAYVPENLPPGGVFRAWLAFADFRQGTTEQGIAFTVAKYVEKTASVVVPNADPALGQHLLGISFRLGQSAAERTASLNFHIEVHTDGTVQELAVLIPNFRAEDNTISQWQSAVNPDGTKTWTFDKPWNSFQDFADSYGFGPYGIVLRWSDNGAGVTRMTHADFAAAPGTRTPFALPAQAPEFTEPAAGAFVLSPATFRWNPWPAGDPAYSAPQAAVRLEVGQAIDESLPKSSQAFGPAALPDGAYHAVLEFDSSVHRSSSDGIPVELTTYRRSQRAFSVGQAGKLEVDLGPQAAIDAGARWTIDDGAGWHESGETLELAPGTYTVKTNAPGWNFSPPAAVSVTLASGTVKTLSLQYQRIVKSITAVLVLSAGQRSVMVEAETGPQVAAIQIATPSGNQFALRSEGDRDDGDALEWDYSAGNLADFSDFGDGRWTVTVRVAGGAEQTVLLPFQHGDGTPLSMPAAPLDIQAPEPRHGRAVMGGPQIQFSWTPYSGGEASLIHVEMQSRGINWRHEGRWIPFDQEVQIPLTPSRETRGDPGTCTFQDVPAGVYRTDFDLADAEQSTAAEGIDTLVAKDRMTRFDLLVAPPDPPVTDRVAQVKIRRVHLTDPNGTVTGLFLADLTQRSGAEIDALRLYPPAGEPLTLAPGTEPQHWISRRSGTPADIDMGFPSGFYTLEIAYESSRGTEYATAGIPVVGNGLAELPPVEQAPQLLSPAGAAASPVDFQWTPCTDAAATDSALFLRPSDQDAWATQREMPLSNTTWTGVALDPGRYRLRLVFLNRSVLQPAADLTFDFGFGAARDFPIVVSGNAATTQVDLALAPGWNLITLPLTPYPDISPRSVFPQATGAVWTWDATQGRYLPAETLDSGRGYWVFLRGHAPANATVAGLPAGPGKIHLLPGWNLVGVPVSPGIQVPAPQDCTVLEWRRDHYRFVSNLEFGQGYWVYCPDPNGETIEYGQ